MKSLALLLVAIVLIMGSCASRKKKYKETSTTEYKKQVNDYRTKRAKEKSIVGNWREFKRTVAEKEQSFSDTLKVVFRADSSSRFYDTEGRLTQGKFKVSKRSYSLGNGNTYDVFEVNKGIIKLGNGNNYSYLQKVDNIYRAPVLKKIPGAEKGIIAKLDADFLQGKWRVYKKEDPSFSRKKRYLQSLEIGEKEEVSSFPFPSYATKILFNNNSKLTSVAGRVDALGNRFYARWADEKIVFDILQATESKMILKDGDVVYYLKNLSK